MVKSKRLDGDQPGPLAKTLKEFLTERVVGQERAIKDLAASADLYEAGFRDFDRPIYSALFLGPSGVGKTLSAEVLAELFFGSRLAFTKVACSDYQEAHAIAKLIGAPPGYVGFWDPKGDPKYPGVEPIFSQYNIDKHDFFHQKLKDKRALEMSKKIKEARKKADLVVKLHEDEFTKGLNKINALREKLEKELQEIDDQLYNIGKEYDELVQQNPDDPKLKVLKEKQNELNNQYRVRQDDVSKELNIESFKTEAELRRIQDNMYKAERVYGNLVKQEKEQFGYSPKAHYRSIILFDEIEKANPSLLRLLLEILDKGRLTLSNGESTKLTNSFIILTSNIGSSKISQILTSGGLGFKVGHKDEESKDLAIYKESLAEATKVLPPEFRGRLNNMIVFRPLSRDSLREILEIQFKELYDSLMKSNFPVVLNIASDVKEFLIDEATGHSDYGARYLKNKVKKHITEPLSRLKNRKEIKIGDIVSVQLLKTKGKKNKVYFQREEKG